MYVVGSNASRYIRHVLDKVQNGNTPEILQALCRVERHLRVVRIILVLLLFVC